MTGAARLSLHPIPIQRPLQTESISTIVSVMLYGYGTAKNLYIIIACGLCDCICVMRYCTVQVFTNMQPFICVLVVQWNNEDCWKY